ncbi:MAG: hypothetical protein WC748_09070, partial [Legionellales bacterium]
MSREDALSAQAGLSLGMNAGVLKASGGGNLNISTAERNNWDIANQSVEQQTVQNQIESALRTDHTGSERHTGETSSRSNESERTSFDDAVGYRDEASSSFSKAQNIREAMTTVEEDSASLNSRADQLVV